MKKILIKRWYKLLDEYERTLFQEYVVFCSLATDGQFENFSKDKLNDREFVEIVEFLCANRCYLLLFRFLRYNRHNCIRPNIMTIKEIKLRKNIQERFERFVL